MATPDPNHHIQFYENDAYLAKVVADYARTGLTAGDAVVLITTPAHREQFSLALRDHGFDVDGYIRIGQLMFLDARHTLSTFMAHGMPDTNAFKVEIGGVIEKARAGKWGRIVRAFAEMVDILWRDGNSDGAVRLEELWNELAERHYFSLLCAYSMHNFGDEAHSKNFHLICANHVLVTPTEQVMNEVDERSRLREIALLQQRARSLENEIQRRKTLEASLRDLVAREQTARDEAENANRLKDEFLALLSHELRTPLNAILGWIQMLDARTDAETVGRALEVIRRNATTQLSLINDLLDVSRIMSGKMSLKFDMVDLAQVICASVDTVRPAAVAKGIDLHASIDQCPAAIAGDPDRLQQVLWNLLTNAIKFTPKGGRVELRVVGEGDRVKVVIEDTGIGIDPQFLPFVFDRFRQADSGTTRKAGGLGLGLAVVRYLVEAHGGGVTAVSRGAGQGATFIIDLPVSVGMKQIRESAA